ncbi:MAG: hypothetical protein E7371_04430 [Clostridiales bacterium]|nr:hypothetical protein [Clostridiales bacterium]
MRKVAVFFGGKSCENEISVLTGIFVMSVLRCERYQLFPVYIHTNGLAYTSPKMTSVDIFRDKKYAQFQRIIIEGGTMYALNEIKGRIKPLFTPDVAINCCHGGLEEGGGISALCRYNDIPLASPDLASSAVFMDKCMTKVVMRGLDIPTVDYIRVNEEDYQKRGAFLLKRIANRLKYPVIVKPAHLGSSIGISLARNETEVKQAIDAAFALDDRILIEKYLQNKQDVNCAAYSLNGEIFVSEAETAFGAGVYSFEEKYIKRTSDGLAGRGRNFTKDGGRYVLSGELREKIRSYTKTVYKRMNLAGAVRMDYLISDGKAYLCEVNTVPGSLAYYLFCERMTDARTFFGDLMEDALRNHQAGEKKILTTGILSGVVGRNK